MWCRDGLKDQWADTACDDPAQYHHNRQSIAQSTKGPCGPQNGPLVGELACGDECSVASSPGAVPVAYKVTYKPPSEPSQVRTIDEPVSNVPVLSSLARLFAILQVSDGLEGLKSRHLVNLSVITRASQRVFICCCSVLEVL